MASQPRIFITVVWVLLAAAACVGQVPLTLEQAASRKAPDFEPVFEKQQIAVHGVVSSQAVHLKDYSHVPIEDASRHGLTLESDEATLSWLHAGDVVEVDGTVFNRAGLPVLQVKNLRKSGAVAPPVPRMVKTADVNSFANLGTTIVVEGTVLTSGENAGGDVLLVGNTGEPSTRIFLPADQRDRARRLTAFQPGDRIRVVGASSQYCPFPPYNRSFQIVVGDPASVSLVKRNWILSVALLLIALAALALSLFIWWFRERSMAAQRKRLRGMTAVSEDVVAAATPAEISRKLVNSLPQLINASRVGIYLFNRSTGSLDRVPTTSDPEPLSVSVTSPVGPLSAALALAFRNRAFLYIPNTRKNPVLQQQPQQDLARSAAFAPLLAQQELLGVLAIEFDETGVFLKSDEQAAVQHLANQIATSLKLQEQHSMREQLLRSEKMAAAGQLISGVANELRGPLNSIKRSVDNILATHPNSVLTTELREIAFEAQRGSEIVGRVVSFAKMDQGESKPLNINTLLASLMEFRETECALKGVLARSNFSITPLIIDGDRSQIEQVMLNLLVHAEQSLFEAHDRQISVTSRSAGKEALIAIDYTDRTPSTGSGDPFSGERGGDSFGLDVCRAIVQSHGGEIRLLRDLPSGSRFEVKLPLRQALTPADESVAPLQRALQPMTVLLVEPDLATQRKLLSLLSTRGHRAVPVNNAEEAIDLVHRLRFDAVFSSVRLPGVNWVELFERIRRKIGVFILLTEGYDSDLSRAFRGSEGYLLSKPIEEKEVERLLSAMESRQESTLRK
jgi:signal transduction histidine kinase/CheY-like chemotaxis protein